MKYCLFIPTTPTHFKNLDKILALYKIGTVQPDEIIISISKSNEISKNEMDYIENKYNCKLMKHKKLMLAGPNRQESIKSESDIIIYHDSDDYPHKQRIEIIKYFFEQNNIVMLNHSYSKNYNEEDIIIQNISIIKCEDIYGLYFPNNILKDCIKYCGAYGGGWNIPICAGPVSIKKEVLNDIKWKDRHELSYSPMWNNLNYKGAEDYEFCMEVLYHFKKSILIDSPIYFIG